MSFHAKVAPANRTIEIGESETVLQAALRQGIDYPHSCTSGRCGACKSRLIRGSVEHLSHLRFTLTDKEKASGLFLACRALPTADLELRWLADSDIEPFRMKARVIMKEQLTHDTWKIVLEIPEGRLANFKPGQHARLSFGSLPARLYSMANQPGEGRLEFFIRVMTQGQVSGYVAGQVNPGMTVDIEGPLGTSYLRADHAGPILAVGGGSGIAPVKSIVEAALGLGMKQDIYLYFGVRSDRDLYLSEHFSSLMKQYGNLHYVPVLEKDAAPHQRSGRVGDAIFDDLKDFDGNWQAYLAGPPAMVSFLEESLTLRGMTTDQIFSDPFL